MEFCRIIFSKFCKSSYFLALNFVSFYPEFEFLKVKFKINSYKYSCHFRLNKAI